MAAQVMALPASTAAGTASSPADSAHPPPPPTVVTTVDVVAERRGSKTAADVTSSPSGSCSATQHTNDVSGSTKCYCKVATLSPSVNSIRRRQTSPLQRAVSERRTTRDMHTSFLRHARLLSFSRWTFICSGRKSKNCLSTTSFSKSPVEAALVVTYLQLLRSAFRA